MIATHAGVEPDAVPTMTDGCGVVAFALPLHVIARMYARLPETLPRQYAAMTAHPELVRGDGDLDTEVMRAIPGCVAKGGAEGLSCFGLPREGLGIAIRVDDGNSRASSPAALAVLRERLEMGRGSPGAGRADRAGAAQFGRRSGRPAARRCGPRNRALTVSVAKPAQPAS